MPWYLTKEYKILSRSTRTPLATGEDICFVENAQQLCQERGIAVIHPDVCSAGGILECKKIGDMAQKYGVSVPQLCVKYVLNLGTVALPKTANAEHMQNNANLDFEISNEDMETLKSLNFKNYGEYSFFPVFSGK